jgi:hypothetical protein
MQPLVILTTCDECWAVIQKANVAGHLQWHRELQEKLDDMERGTHELREDMFSAGIHL